MPTAQGRSATTRPFYVLIDAAGRIPFVRKFLKKVNHNIHLLANKFKAVSTNRSSSISWISLQLTGSSGLAVPAPALSLSGIRINGEEDNQV